MRRLSENLCYFRVLTFTNKYIMSIQVKTVQRWLSNCWLCESTLLKRHSLAGPFLITATAAAVAAEDYV
jgi:hypothetical protein